MGSEMCIRDRYKCEEYFPRDFAIYDLSQFLAGIRILDNPSLVFDNDEYVVLRGTNMSMRYYFSDPAITLKNASYGKDFPFPDSCMNLPVSEDVLGKIQNVSSQFRLPDLIFTSSSDKVSIVLKDSCLLYTSPSPRDATLSRMPSSA